MSSRGPSLSPPERSPSAAASSGLLPLDSWKLLAPLLFGMLMPDWGLLPEPPPTELALAPRCGLWPDVALEALDALRAWNLALPALVLLTPPPVWFDVLEGRSEPE